MVNFVVFSCGWLVKIVAFSSATDWRMSQFSATNLIFFICFLTEFLFLKLLFCNWLTGYFISTDWWNMQVFLMDKYRIWFSQPIAKFKDFSHEQVVNLVFSPRLTAKSLVLFFSVWSMTNILFLWGFSPQSTVKNFLFLLPISEFLYFFSHAWLTNFVIFPYDQWT